MEAHQIQSYTVTNYQSLQFDEINNEVANPVG